MARVRMPESTRPKISAPRKRLAISAASLSRSRWRARRAYQRAAVGQIPGSLKRPRALS